MCGVLWQPLNGVQSPLTVKDASEELIALLFDVTNTRSGGVTARLAGKLDGTVEVNAIFDLDNPTYAAAPFLLAAAAGVLAFYVSPTKAIQLPMSIERVKHQFAVEQEVRYAFTAKLNSLVGVIVYPSV